MDTIEIKHTIKEYGVDEKYFLETLDEMTEQAFNDQCTGANPRYPLMSELKEIYLKAYYGASTSFDLSAEARMTFCGTAVSTSSSALSGVMSLMVQVKG